MPSTNHSGIDDEDETNWYTIDDAISAIGSGPFQHKLLFLTGFIWAADAMEMMLLSFLIPKLKEDWDLDKPEDGLIGFVVFAGNLLGTIFFSIISDRYGRRSVVIICNLLCAIFGLLTGISPNIELLLIFRFGVGFSIGGSAVSYVLFAEYAPKELRGSLLIIEQGFWSFGALFSVFLAWISLSYLDWRWYLILSSVPLWIISIFFKWVPESSRWLLASGKHKKAEEMLRRVARENKATLPEGRLKPIYHAHSKLSNRLESLSPSPTSPGISPDLVDERNDTNSTDLPNQENNDNNNNNDKETNNNNIKNGEKKGYNSLTNNSNTIESADEPINLAISDSSELSIKRGKITDAFVPAYRKTTILLLIAFFLCVFGYYGISFISERYFETSDDDNNSDRYWEMAVTTSSEIPGLIFGSLLLDKWGRKNCMVICFGIYSVCCLFLTLEVIQYSRVFGIFFMFMGRMTVSLGFLIIYVYYSEYYPTLIRTTTLGFASSMGRVAGMITSFVSEDLGLTTGMILYGAGGLISTLCVLLLDQDTTGMDMASQIDNKSKEEVNREKRKRETKDGHIELTNTEVDIDLGNDNDNDNDNDNNNENENEKGYDMRQIEIDENDNNDKRNKIGSVDIGSDDGHVPELGVVDTQVVEDSN